MLKTIKKFVVERRRLGSTPTVWITVGGRSGIVAKQRVAAEDLAIPRSALRGRTPPSSILAGGPAPFLSTLLVLWMGSARHGELPFTSSYWH
jgi:hypothetical protein